MAELYGAKGGGFRCPGESCPRFRSTAGKPAAVAKKILDTCSRCRGNAPSEDSPECGDEVTETVERVERIARERDTCRGLDRREIDADDYELLLFWDECVAAHEAAHKARVAQLFELVAAQFQPRGR